MMRTTSSRMGRHGMAFLSLAILLVILTLSLTACAGGRGALGSTSGASTSPQSNTQAPTSTSYNSAQQQLQNTDQQIQSSMQIMDGASGDAQNADNNGGDSTSLP